MKSQNIQSMYSDIDLDSNDIETEFKSSFEHLTEFIKMYLEATTSYVADDKDKIDVIFNKDILINESQVITDIKDSVGIISSETLIENHPYIDDPAKELERIKKEKAENNPLDIDDKYGLGGGDVDDE